MRSTNLIAIIVIITATLIMSAFVIVSTIQEAKAQLTDNNMITATATDNAINRTGNITIGNLIYEDRGKITGQRVLEGPIVETSFSSNGTISNGLTNLNVTEIGTYTSTPRANGALYGEGEGVIIGRNNEMATWKSQEIGNITPAGKILFHGSIFYRSLSPVGSLAFVDNMVGVFTFEVDPSRNTISRVWELR